MENLLYICYLRLMTKRSDHIDTNAKDHNHLHYEQMEKSFSLWGRKDGNNLFLYDYSMYGTIIFIYLSWLTAYIGYCDTVRNLRCLEPEWSVLSCAQLSLYI